MTHGSLRRDIPTLEPDDDFVARLAALAAASRPSRGGVVVPMAFGGPASRAMVVATAVAALTAGAAAAAQLGHQSRDVPAPPVTSTGIQRPQDPDRAGQAEARDLAHRTDVTSPAANPVAQHDGVVRNHPSTGGSTVAADPRVPRHQETSDDQAGDETGGQTDGNDGQGDQNDSSSGPGTDDSGDTDGTSGDTGGSDDGTSNDGSQDGGGTQTGSGDGSDAGSTSGPSFVLNGDSD